MSQEDEDYRAELFRIQERRRMAAAYAREQSLRGDPVEAARIREETEALRGPVEP